MSSACAQGVPRCRLIGSAICRPTVSAGLSEVIGSWKIIAMRSPRTARICASRSFSRSWPSNRISPAGDPARRVGDQAQDRQRGDALARARLADDGQRLAGRDVEGHVVDRGDRAALGAKARASGRAPTAGARSRISEPHLLLQLLVDPDARVDRAGAHGAGAQLAAVVLHPRPPAGVDVGRGQHRSPAPSPGSGASSAAP